MAIEFHIDAVEAAAEMRKMQMSRKDMRAIVRKRLIEARRAIRNDAKTAMRSDPRQARRAVKIQIYKKLFGGNVNILDTRKVTYLREYQKRRTLRQGQRGGNRRKPSDRTRRVDNYYGESRAFVLRFQNSGARRNKRGTIAQSGWFEASAQRHIEAAANAMATDIENKITNDFNNSR